MGPRVRGQAEAGRGRLPPDGEVLLRQLLREIIHGLMKLVKTKSKVVRANTMTSSSENDSISLA